VKRIPSDAASLGIQLSTAQEQQIQRFETLLMERAIPLGLVARSDRDRLYVRHILDSLRAAALFRPSDVLAYDLGSGGGLPGIPLAIALPRIRFTLAESRSKRAGFLELVVHELGLPNVRVHSGAAETMEPAADVITARAFAPLEQAWPLAVSLLRSGGRLIYFAGEGLDDPERKATDLPGPPRHVTVEKVLETWSPLVMMTLE
jgi:16S rRNA (guanine527-N7)-methyltransferase